MTTIQNPITKRNIKIGSKTHLDLIGKNLLERNTLDIGKVPITDNSRQHRPISKLEFFTHTTHFTNVKEIAKATGIDTFKFIEMLSHEFEEFKLLYIKDKQCILVFPGREPFVENAIDDIVNKMDVDWNQ
jgi:hypothetical protein